MEKTHKKGAGETLPIVREPDKVLRKKAADLARHDITTPHIQKLISAMKATLAQTPDGVGLAAPQVGKSLRMFIVSEEAEEIDRTAAEVTRARRHGTGGAMSHGNRALNEPQHQERNYEKRPWKYYVFINPVVKNSSRRKLAGPEGCLSVPGKFGEVARHEKISVEAHDEHGRIFRRNASRFFARVVQHELDHLDGTLFIDKVEHLFDVEKP